VVVTAVIVVAALAALSLVVALVVQRRAPEPEPTRELVEVVSQMRVQMDVLSQDLSRPSSGRSARADATGCSGSSAAPSTSRS